MERLEHFLVPPECSIHEAMARIDRNAKGIVLVVDPERRLIGTVSDGDIRRAILNGIDLSEPVLRLIQSRASSSSFTPITAPVGVPDADLLRLMNKHGVRQLPIISPEGRVMDMAFLSDLVKEYELPLTAVIMAGGYGTRLRPLTEKIPKPMLQIGGRPLLEHTIRQLERMGIHRVNVTTHYKADVITEHFGDGHHLGVQIGYVQEDQPLGTAGALSLLGELNEPMLVINGDILTQVDFRAMLAYHRKHEACLTVGVRQYDLEVPYGVIECQGPRVSRITEKPVMRFFVNAGIYLVESVAQHYIPVGRRFDMTDLIRRLLDENCPVANFPITEYWLDVGRPMDYQKAQEDLKNGRLNP